jgi:hypothetical protein
MQNGFGVVRIFHVLCDSENIATFADVVFYVIIRALVGELGHFDSANNEGQRDLVSLFGSFYKCDYVYLLLRRELFIQVK